MTVTARHCGMGFVDLARDVADVIEYQIKLVMAANYVDEGLWVLNLRESGSTEGDKWAKETACWGGSRGKQWDRCCRKAGNS